jgi:hypothetical protein
MAPDDLAPKPAVLLSGMLGYPSSPSLSHALVPVEEAAQTADLAVLPVAAAPSGNAVVADCATAQTDKQTTMLNENNALTNADMMLKLLMLSPELAQSPSAGTVSACEEYNELISCLASSQEGCDPVADVKALRHTLTAAHAVLKDSLDRPCAPRSPDSQGRSQGEEHRLTVPMIDMLRTAAMVSNGAKREYSRACRSMEARANNALCLTFHKRVEQGATGPSGEEVVEKRASDTDLEAYATAQNMFHNFEHGLSIIKDWSIKDDEFLFDVITSARQKLFCFLQGFTFVSMFDGRRMRHANAVASRFYHRMGPAFNPENIFGESEVVAAVFDYGTSLRCLSRILWTVCAIVHMVRQHVQVQWCIHWGAAFGTDYLGLIAKEEAREKKQSGSSADSGPSAEDVEMLKKIINHANQSCVEDITWKSVHGLLEAVQKALIDPSKGEQARESSNVNCNVIEAVVEWFESAARDQHKFGVIVAAFQSECFCLYENYPNPVRNKDARDKRDPRYCDEMCGQWQEFRHAVKDMPPVPKKVSLWTASHFLVACRLRRCWKKDVPLAGSNVLSNCLVVLSGAIGILVDDTVAGPFVFDDKFRAKIGKLFDDRFPARYKYPKANAKLRCGDNLEGKACHDTKITRLIAVDYKVRGQHEKSNLVATRLSTSMFALSLKSNALRDIKPGIAKLADAKKGAVPDMVEGSKGMRQLNIVAFETLPCAQYRTCHQGSVSHLIEKNRKEPLKQRTTADNVEKPWRDIQGGVFIGTLLYPLAGTAFLKSIEQLIDLHPRKRTDKQQEEMENKRAEHEKSLEDSGHWDADDVEEKMERYDELMSKSFSHTTSGCVNIFSSELAIEAERVFKHSLTSKPQSGMVLDGLDHAATVFGQQRSFAVHFCELIRNTGVLWEDMQLLFSIQDETERRRGKRPMSGDGNSDDDYDHMPPPLPALVGVPRGADEYAFEDDEVRPVTAPPTGAGGSSSNAVSNMDMDEIKYYDEEEDEDEWEDAYQAPLKRQCV